MAGSRASSFILLAMSYDSFFLYMVCGLEHNISNMVDVPVREIVELLVV